MRRRPIILPVIALVSLAVACLVGTPSIFRLGNDSDRGVHKSLLGNGAAMAQGAAETAGPIRVVYPRNGSQIAASSTFLIGCCTEGTALTCNDLPVKVNSKGFFAHVVKLTRGKNTFLLKLDTGATREISVEREGSAPTMSPDRLAFAPTTATPGEDRGVATGDLIEFKVKATPGCAVSVQLGSSQVVMYPPLQAVSKIRRGRVPAKSAKGKAGAKGGTAAKSQSTEVKLSAAAVNVNPGLDAAFGKMFQRYASAPRDLYVGFYRIQSTDRFNNVTPIFVLSRAGSTITTKGKGRITTVDQPLVAQTLSPKTIVRLGPGAARTTPLFNGVRVLVDGWYGKHMRCLYCPGRHVWIERQELAFENEANFSTPPPNTVARTINIESDAYGESVVVPLNQRLPYQIEQQLNPNRLVLRIFGVTADTDWESTAEGVKYRLIDHVTWRQPQDDCYEVVVDLRSARQWGFWAEYRDTDLILHVKKPPTMNANSQQRLAGLFICVDPGHGGTEPGSFGCNGMREAEVNLQISLRLKAALEQAGARVIMTRLGDDTRSLDERVEIANKAGVDVLLSVHNNALPDGRDPWAEHGTSSYWYHPQALELARSVRKSVVEEIGFPDYATRYQNLALCRPSKMLALLVEVGFMIHPDEFAQLIDPRVQAKTAQGIVDGLAQYLDGSATKMTIR